MLALDPQWLDGVGLNAARDIAGLIGISGPYDFLPLRDPTLVDILEMRQSFGYATGSRLPRGASRWLLLVTGDADKVVRSGQFDAGLPTVPCGTTAMRLPR